MTETSWHPDSQTTVDVNAATGDLNVTMAMLQSAAGVNLPISMNFVSNGQQASASGEARYIAWDWIGSFDENLYIDPTGQSVTFFGPDGQSAAFIKNGSSWNAPGDLPATLTVEGNGDYQLSWNTADSYHQAGQVDTFTSSGELLSQRSVTGQSLNLAYNGNGTPSTMTTSTGRTFNFNYYPSGANAGYLQNIVEAGTTFEVQFGYNASDLLTSIENPDGGITQFGYQSANNQITSVTTPAGRELLIGWDPSTNTHVNSVAQVDSDFSTNPTWNFTYTPSTYSTGATQCVPGQTAFQCGTTVVKDPNGHATTYVWDNADRVTNTTDANGQTQATTWNSDNDVVNLTDNNNNVESFTWDNAHDVLTGITNPSETLHGSQVTGGATKLVWTTTSSPYTLKSVQDSTNSGSTVSYTYNADNEVSQIQDGLATQNTETATYQGIGGVTCGGLAGDLCSITDFDGNTTNYTYNSIGELTSITPPTNSGTQLGVTSFGYNPLGQVASEEQNGRGDTTSYLYNGENQITKVSYQDGTSVTLKYDADGNLQTETAPGGGSTFAYNPAGLLKTSDIDGDSTSYSYDPAGNLKTLNGPGGNTTYSYTAINELSQVADPWGNTETFGYEPTNDQELHTVNLPGSITETYGYDNAARVTSYQVTNGSGTQLFNNTYSYFTTTGADANLLQTYTNTAGQTTTYGYDPLERLTSASTTGGGTSYSYTYNGDGDLTSQTIGGTNTTFSLNTNHENTANTYDPAGNLLSAAGLGTFAYNTANQTSSITPAGGTAQAVSYLSDGQDQPATIGSVNLDYNALGLSGANQGPSKLGVLRTPNGTLLGEYNTAPYYYLLDPTGSVIGLTSANGTLANSYSYSPYGVQTATTNNIYSPFGYQSGYQLPNTNLIHYGARYYNPNTGTWTQPDPSRQNPGYVYASDDPINAIDLTGLLSAKDVLGGTSVGSGAVALGCSIAGAATGGAAALGCGIVAGTISLETGIASLF